MLRTCFLSIVVGAMVLVASRTSQRQKSEVSQLLLSPNDGTA